MVALLRGINVGGHQRVPMETLRTLATEAGCTAPRTYIASGNLVFESTLAPATLEAALERAIAKHFGFEVPVVVRTARQWADCARGSPFTRAETERPHLLHLGLSKAPPVAGCIELLNAKATPPEQVALAPGGVWLDYAGGVARSRLTPAVLDKAVGSSVTARNFKTVLQLRSMLNG